MTTTLVPPPSCTRSSASHERGGWPTGSAHDSYEDSASGATDGLRRTRVDDSRAPGRGIDWCRIRRSEHRLDAVLSSTAAYLVSVGVVVILACVVAGVFAQWMNGPVN
jgi:hypothetical protein